MSKPFIEIIIRGPHNTGRTTMAHWINEKLRELEYEDVTIEDTQPLPEGEKLALSRVCVLLQFSHFSV